MGIAVRSKIEEVLKESNQRIVAFLRDPSAVASEVKEVVIGQDEHVEKVKGMLYGMLLRTLKTSRCGMDESLLPNVRAILLIASTASGKTHMVRAFLDRLSIPSVFADCSQLTGAGWKGANVRDFALEAQRQLECRPETPVALVFDEADKLAFDLDGQARSANAQSDFLKLLDGGLYFSPGEKDDPDVRLDTGKCLFIFMGAFTGVEDIVRARLRDGGGMGFCSSDSGASSSMSVEELRELVTIDDLVEYGMAPEFLGRIATLCHLPKLSVGALEQIVKGSKNSLEKRYSRLAPDNVEVVIEEEAARCVARKADESGLGARMLEGYLSPIVLGKLARLGRVDGTARLVVTRDDVEKGGAR